MGDRIRTMVIIVVTCVWALNFVATLAIPSYEAPPEINSIFMGMVGTALATTPIVGRRGRRGNEEGEGPQEPASREGQP